jgi:hypothetical protein
MAQLKCCRLELPFVQADAPPAIPMRGVKRSVSARRVLALGSDRMLFIMFKKENHMRVRICMLWIAVIMPSALASAQHLEIGGFASYGNFDVPRFPDTAVGVGGRLDINSPWKERALTTLNILALKLFPTAPLLT